jgi:hypothetical protein
MLEVSDILRKRAEKLFKMHGGAISDQELVKVFKLSEIRLLQRAKLIRTDAIDPAWFWVIGQAG